MSLDTSKPVRTRDGRAAHIIRSDSDHTMGPYRYPVVAEVEHPNDQEAWVRWHYMDTGWWKSNEPENGNDLVNYAPN
jgi:hypothetical protein